MMKRDLSEHREVPVHFTQHTRRLPLSFSFHTNQWQLWDGRAFAVNQIKITGYRL